MHSRAQRSIDEDSISYHPEEFQDDQINENDFSDLTETIYVNRTKVGYDPEKQKKNEIKLSKYTWQTCIPAAFVYELTKPVNIYFILAAGLSYLPGSPKEPGVNTLTLAAIFLIMIVKEINEDLKRQKIEKATNNTPVTSYSYKYLCYHEKPAH